MSNRLTTTDGLKAGDVLVVATKIEKRGEEAYWWKRFACVFATSPSKRHVDVLTLKMHPTDKDHKFVPLCEDNSIVTLLPEDQWPQGVIAMRMKLIMQGIIKLGED